jgi:hypothetical protein
MLHHDTCGDHIRAIGVNSDGHLERIGNPDWESIYYNCDGESTEEDTVSFSDMGAALAIILQWICSSKDLRLAGARAASLLCFLDPVNAPHGRDSLTKIASEADCTKAALSAALLDLRDQTGCALSMGKLASTRERYAQAQKAAVQAGCHSRSTRKDSVKRRAAEEISLEAVAG